jgi:hypothetical protein
MTCPLHVMHMSCPWSAEGCRYIIIINGNPNSLSAKGSWKFTRHYSQPYISRNKVHKFSPNFESGNKGSEVFQHQKPEKVPVYTKFQFFLMPYICASSLQVQLITGIRSVDTSWCNSGTCSADTRPAYSAGICSVDTSRCNTGPSSADTSRNYKGICSVDKSRCNSGRCSADTSRSYTGLCSVETPVVQTSPAATRTHRPLKCRHVQVELKPLWCRHV